MMSSGNSVQIEEHPAHHVAVGSDSERLIRLQVLAQWPLHLGSWDYRSRNPQRARYVWLAEPTYTPATATIHLLCKSRLQWSAVKVSAVIVLESRVHVH